MTGKTKAKITVDFSRVTVREFMLFLGACQEGGSMSAILKFCDKVVEGGIEARDFTELEYIMAEVSQALQYNMDRIGKSIELGRLMGKIDEHLDGES